MVIGVIAPLIGSLVVASRKSLVCFVLFFWEDGCGGKVPLWLVVYFRLGSMSPQVRCHRRFDVTAGSMSPQVRAHRRFELTAGSSSPRKKNDLENQVVRSFVRFGKSHPRQMAKPASIAAALVAFDPALSRKPMTFPRPDLLGPLSVNRRSLTSPSSTLKRCPRSSHHCGNAWS